MFMHIVKYEAYLSLGLKNIFTKVRYKNTAMKKMLKKISWN